MLEGTFKDQCVYGIRDKTCRRPWRQLYRSCNVKVLNIQNSRGGKRGAQCLRRIFTLRLPLAIAVNRLMTLVGKRKGIVSVEEL